MGKCFNCGKDIPNWFSPQLCTMCLGYELTSDRSIVTKTDEYSKEISSSGYVGEPAQSLAPVKHKNSSMGLYKLSDEKIKELLKQDRQSVRIQLLTMLREKCATLLTGFLRYGTVSDLSKDIQKELVDKKVTWHDSLIN